MEYLPILNRDNIFKAQQQKSPTVTWHPYTTLPRFDLSKLLLVAKVSRLFLDCDVSVIATIPMEI